MQVVLCELVYQIHECLQYKDVVDAKKSTKRREEKQMSVPDQPKLEAHEDPLVIQKVMSLTFFPPSGNRNDFYGEAARIYQYLLLLFPEHTTWLYPS